MKNKIHLTFVICYANSHYQENYCKKNDTLFHYFFKEKNFNNIFFVAKFMTFYIFQ